MFQKCCFNALTRSELNFCVYLQPAAVALPLAEARSARDAAAAASFQLLRVRERQPWRAAPHAAFGGAPTNASPAALLARRQRQLFT